MKVIKRGQKIAERLGRFECGDCKSIIEAKAGDAHTRASSYQGLFLYFNCPVCNHGVGIEENKFFKNLTTLG
jgi:hypothetical protein